VLLDLVLEKFGLNSEVGQLLLQSLRLYAQSFALLLSNLDLLFHKDGPLDGHIVFRFEVFEGGGRVARLALEIVVGHLDIAKSHLQRPVCVPQCRDLFF
jgi:hypothetical protein